MAIYSTILAQIESDFAQYNGEIKEAYKQFRIGEKLILNNEAVVEWVGVSEIEKKGRLVKVAVFKTKPSGQSSGATISIPFKQIIKLQSTNRKALSSATRVCPFYQKEYFPR